MTGHDAEEAILSESGEGYAAYRCRTRRMVAYLYWIDGSGADDRCPWE